MPVSQMCFAYKMLKKQIGQQCKIYGDLSQTGKLGSLPGMYVPNEEGRDIPADSTSAFLRGGIINTMACFEAYLFNLLNEAADTILYHRNPACSGICEECIQLEHDHVVKDQPLRDNPELAFRSNEQRRIMKIKAQVLFDGKSITWSDINEVYSHKFGRGKDSFTKELFSVGDIATLSPQQIQDQKKFEEQQLNIKHRTEQRQNEKQRQNELTKPQSYEPAELNRQHKQEKQNLARSHQQWQHDHGMQHNDMQCEECELKPMTYYYPVDSYKISQMDFKNQDLLNMMLNFCYGTRCVLTHGNATQTEEKALKNFPGCKDPPCDDCHNNRDCQQCTETIKKLVKIGKLSKHFDTCITEKGKKRVLKTSRHFPSPKPFMKLRNELALVKDHAMTILQELFPALYHGNLIECQQEVLDENYALYHMCRIHSYLTDKNKKMMYITYRLLVRINQFILVLAHRMRMAVGRILIYKYGLPDGTWGVPRSKQGQIDKINKFEKGHRKMVIDLGKFQAMDSVVIKHDFVNKPPDVQPRGSSVEQIKISCTALPSVSVSSTGCCIVGLVIIVIEIIIIIATVFFL